jgi:hypothetical protein
MNALKPCLLIVCSLAIPGCLFGKGEPYTMGHAATANFLDAALQTREEKRHAGLQHRQWDRQHYTTAPQNDYRHMNNFYKGGTMTSHSRPQHLQEPRGSYARMPKKPVPAGPKTPPRVFLPAQTRKTTAKSTAPIHDPAR